MHIMIDVETLSLAVDAAIKQVGIVGFSLDGSLFLEKQYDIIVKGQNRAIDWSTMQWWLKRPEAARLKFVKDGTWELPAVLSHLTEFCDWPLVEGVWSHGASFDIPMLSHAFAQHNTEVPWGFRVVRDTRTLFWLAGVGLDTAPGHAEHTAVVDALAQAKAVQRAYARLTFTAVTEGGDGTSRLA